MITLIVNLPAWALFTLAVIGIWGFFAVAEALHEDWQNWQKLCGAEEVHASQHYTHSRN